MTSESSQTRRIVAKGWTSTIYQHEDADKVVKVPTGEQAPAFLDIERRIYECLSENEPHPSSILKYYGVDSMYQKGIVLEKADKGDLYMHLRQTLRPSGKSDPTLLLKWARQAAESLAFAHGHGIIHHDVHEANFFLDGDLNLKLGDFGASLIDGSPGLMMYRTTHQLWLKNDRDEWRRDSSVAAEIFALGCVFYCMEAGQDVFEEQDEKDEIKRRLQQRDLPDTLGLSVLGGVIGKCWSGAYQSMIDVLRDLDSITPPPSVD